MLDIIEGERMVSLKSFGIITSFAKKQKQKQKLIKLNKRTD